MEAQACGHTLMSGEQRLAATAALLDTIELEDANAAARELCEHLSHPDVGQDAGASSCSVRPSAVVACAPAIDGRSGLPFQVSEEEVRFIILCRGFCLVCFALIYALLSLLRQLLATVAEAMSIEVEPPSDTAVPTTLVSKEKLQSRAAETNPSWVRPLILNRRCCCCC